MALIDLTEAKAHLNISTTASDTELQTMVNRACALVQAHADRVWDVGSVTETFDGGTDTFLLSKSPITAITSVTVNGTATTNYRASLSSGIVWTGFCTYPARQSVVIVYAVGDAAPSELVKGGALETLRHLWATQRGTVVRQPMSGDEYPTGEGYSLPRRVIEMLESERAIG